MAAALLSLHLFPLSWLGLYDQYHQTTGLAAFIFERERMDLWICSTEKFQIKISSMNLFYGKIAVENLIDEFLFYEFVLRKNCSWKYDVWICSTEKLQLKIWCMYEFVLLKNCSWKFDVWICSTEKLQLKIWSMNCGSTDKFLLKILSVEINQNFSIAVCSRRVGTLLVLWESGFAWNTLYIS